MDWKGSGGRPHKLVLSAPLAASPRPATTSADLRGALRGGTREGSSTRSPALPHSARGISSGIRPSTMMTPRRSRGSSNPSAFLAADRIHEEKLSSSSPRRHASGATTASPRSRATTRAGGAGGGNTSTSPSGGKHIILGQLQRRTFRSFDEDGVEVQLSIGGALDSSAEDENGRMSPIDGGLIPPAAPSSKSPMARTPRAATTTTRSPPSGKLTGPRLGRTVDGLASLRRALQLPIVVAEGGERWSLDQAEEHERQMWENERLSRTLRRDIDEARHHIAQVSAVEEFLTVKREAECWFNHSPRCLHYQEHVSRESYHERKAMEAESLESREEFHHKIVAKWGRLFRGKVALLRRVVRNALKELRGRQALSIMTVQRILRGGIARKMVKNMRQTHLRHTVDSTIKIQALYRGMRGRRVSRFISKMATNSEAHQRLFEAQRAFAEFDQNGNGLVDVEEVRLALARLGVELMEDEVMMLLETLSRTSYYKNESMRTIVSFVDFCELLGMNSSKMSAEKMQEAVIIFSKVDTEGVGFLSEEQLMGAVQQMEDFTGKKVTQTEIRDCVAATRHMGFGDMVQFEHFVSLFGVDTGAAEAEMDERVDRARKTFDKIDADGSGAITLPELLEGLGEINVEADPDEMKRMFEEVDEDGSGLIDFLEFCRLIGILNIPRRIRRRFAVKTKDADRLVVEDVGEVLEEKTVKMEDESTADVETTDMGDPVVGLKGICTPIVGLRVRQTRGGRERSLESIKKGQGVITQVVLKGKRVNVLHDEGPERFYNVGLKGEYDLCAVHLHLCKTDSERKAYWDSQPHLVADTKERSLGFEIPKNHKHKRFDHINRSLQVVEVLAQQDRNGFRNPDLREVRDHLMGAMKWTKATSHLRPTLDRMTVGRENTLRHMLESAQGKKSVLGVTAALASQGSLRLGHALHDAAPGVTPSPTSKPPGGATPANTPFNLPNTPLGGSTSVAATPLAGSASVDSSQPGTPISPEEDSNGGQQRGRGEGASPGGTSIRKWVKEDVEPEQLGGHQDGVASISHIDVSTKSLGLSLPPTIPEAPHASLAADEEAHRGEAHQGVEGSQGVVEASQQVPKEDSLSQQGVQEAQDGGGLGSVESGVGPKKVEGGAGGSRPASGDGEEKRVVGEKERGDGGGGGSLPTTRDEQKKGKGEGGGSKSATGTLEEGMSRPTTGDTEGGGERKSRKPKMLPKSHSFSRLIKPPSVRPSSSGEFSRAKSTGAQKVKETVVGVMAGQGLLARIRGTNSKANPE